MPFRHKVAAGFLLILTSHSATAQSSQFQFRRIIDGPAQQGWYSLPLPADIFRSLNHDFSDLRIYQFKGSDTLEISYLLRVRVDLVQDTLVELPIFNKSKKNGNLFLTVELKKNQRVNRLDLEFAENNFNGYVLLEGSQDQKDWYTIDPPQRILSIQNNDITFKATTLNFPLTNYRYLRIQIQSDKELPFRKATFKRREIQYGVNKDIASRWSAVTSRKTKETTLQVRLMQFQPVNSVKISVDNKIDFYRPLTIEALRDSAKTTKGWIYLYDHIYSGCITSLNDSSFDFPFTLAKQLRITVRNADNPSLNFKNISVRGPVIELVTRLAPAENYLYYGKTSSAVPSYDLVHFSDKIPRSPMVASTGPEEKISIPVEKSRPLFENKLWLWAIMGVVIALLGFFTLKMMKSR